MSVSITDIAIDTGLSIATISKYLHNGKLKEANHKKIAESIDRLGYIPSMNAQSLKNNKVPIIAICISQLTNFFWGKAIGLIEKRLRDAGYWTTIHSIRENLNEEEMVSRLISYNISGVIMIPSASKVMDLSLLEQKQIAIIFLGLMPSNLSYNFITSDNYMGAYDCTKYLIERNHTNIGYIAGNKNLQPVRDRINGFKAACNDAHIRINEQYCSSGECTSESGKKQFLNLLKQDTKPTAIACLGAEVALGCLLEANYKNIIIGKDISMISFDDKEYFSYSYPPITAVVQDMQLIAQKTADSILAQINNQKNKSSATITTDMTKTQTYYIKTSIIERASVKDLRNVSNN